MLCLAQLPNVNLAAGHTTYRPWSFKKKSVVKHVARCSLKNIISQSAKMGQPFEMVPLDDRKESYVRDPSNPGKIRKVIREQSFQRTKSRERSEGLFEDDLYLEGVGYVTVAVVRSCLTWHLTEPDDELVGSSCWGRRDTEKTLGQVLISEIYASELCEMASPAPVSLCGLYGAPLPQMYRFAVHTFGRSPFNKCNWIPKVHMFYHEDRETCQAWVEHLQGLLGQDIHRPKNLLVLVNPFGGKGNGVQQWESVAPLFDRARVKTKVILTERAGHARDLMIETNEEDLKKQDGVIVVGGDGFFNEVLNGLLMNRHKGHTAPKPQQVAEMLANDSKVQKKVQTNGTKTAREGFRSLDVMSGKLDPQFGSIFDVHSPLLESSPHVAVDMSRPTSSSSATSSAFTADNEIEARFQEEAGNLTLVHSASGKESEMSALGTGPVKLASEAVNPEEGNFVFPIADQGTMTSTVHGGDGSGLFGLASLGQQNSSGNSGLQLRIGIIPAGSTDTIAISTTGSRDPITAALHILLGDSNPLDVVRITGWKQTPQSGDEQPQVRYAASFAGYGFYGDVMKESETTRWMGPARYDIAGVKVFMKHKKYEAEVSFLEIPTPRSNNGRDPAHRKIICRANCLVCAQGIDMNHLVSEDGEDEEDEDQLQSLKPRWRTTRDSFHSIGAAVMSCRNDKAPDGVAAHAHLADGFLHLILIRSCSRPNYLRQLITLTRRGADPFDFDFVEHYKTPVFTFTSFGEESIWNVDGELFPAHQLSAQCFRGLVNLFARGPEV